ncbi:Short-chain dehydrogenase [Natronoarchaeum philippinense]|uniref:Short-chain dehydrogenase n=1 Tax=Natronoarchaeum philippinense TaxID=558529 RepID=A0A285P043_NATPI|nr:SDR family oxidoreductase [Natronoarchaeum philippinense]SNZ15095.1 Short-chain dehydrogenase [Natronoarchaeum philippinense]
MSDGNRAGAGGDAHGDETPVALITGAASGIGAATATALADRGWRVYATDIEMPLPEELRERCTCRELDVTDAEQCERVVEEIVDETGRIDALVNNAGYAVPGPIEDVDPEDARRQFDVLVHGVGTLCRAVLPEMRAAGHGRIVNVSSVLGMSTVPGVGTYCAGKAALESLTDALRIELRDTGVDVSLVEPAWVDTGFADGARERLDGDRTDAYGDTYAALDRGWVLEGGPLAADPEAVAERIVAAATTASPRARYPVGTFAHFVRWTHILPARLQDPIQRWFGRVSITANRLYQRLGGLP